MNDFIIRAQDVHKFYNHGQKKLHVLKGINLNLEKSQTLGIYGPSGAGKSTLLHILGGLDEPSAGRVLFRDKDLYGLGDKELAEFRNRSVGFIFQRLCAYTVHGRR